MYLWNIIFLNKGIERSAFQNNSNMLVLKLALINSARNAKVWGWSGRGVLPCRCPSPPGGRDQVSPLKATAGTQNSSLPLSFSSFLLFLRGFTISSRWLRSQLDPLKVPLLSDSNNNKSESLLNMSTSWCQGLLMSYFGSC